MPAKKETSTKYESWPPREWEALKPRGPGTKARANSVSNRKVWAAFYYEYAREANNVCAAIESWRNRHLPGKLEKLIEPFFTQKPTDKWGAPERNYWRAVEVMTLGNPWCGKEEQQIVPAAFLASFAEFPDKPWYEVPNSPARRYWLSEAAWERMPWANYSSWFDLQRNPQPDYARLAAELALADAKKGAGVLLVTFDWPTHDDGDLISQMRSWLKQKRPRVLKSKKGIKESERHFLGRALGFQPFAALGFLNETRKLDRAPRHIDHLLEQGLDAINDSNSKKQRMAMYRAARQAASVIRWFNLGGKPPKIGRKKRPKKRRKSRTKKFIGAIH